MTVPSYVYFIEPVLRYLAAQSGVLAGFPEDSPSLRARSEWLRSPRRPTMMAGMSRMGVGGGSMVVSVAACLSIVATSVTEVAHAQPSERDAALEGTGDSSGHVGEAAPTTESSVSGGEDAGNPTEAGSLPVVVGNAASRAADAAAQSSAEAARDGAGSTAQDLAEGAPGEVAQRLRDVPQWFRLFTLSTLSVRAEFHPDRVEIDPTYVPDVGLGYSFEQSRWGVFAYPGLSLRDLDDITVAPHVGLHAYFFTVGAGFEWNWDEGERDTELSDGVPFATVGLDVTMDSIGRLAIGGGAFRTVASPRWRIPPGTSPGSGSTGPVRPAREPRYRPGALALVAGITGAQATSSSVVDSQRFDDELSRGVYVEDTASTESWRWVGLATFGLRYVSGQVVGNPLPRFFLTCDARFFLTYVRTPPVYGTVLDDGSRTTVLLGNGGYAWGFIPTVGFETLWRENIRLDYLPSMGFGVVVMPSADGGHSAGVAFNTEWLGFGIVGERFSARVVSSLLMAQADAYNMLNLGGRFEVEWRTKQW